MSNNGYHWEYSNKNNLWKKNPFLIINIVKKIQIRTICETKPHEKEKRLLMFACNALWIRCISQLEPKGGNWEDKEMVIVCADD